MAQRVKVTDLANYAVDPVSHIERGNAPANRAAAKAGRKAHAMFRSRLGYSLVLASAGLLGLYGVFTWPELLMGALVAALEFIGEAVLWVYELLGKVQS